MYFFNSSQFGKTQKAQIRHALEAGSTDRLLCILSTYEPNPNSYELIDSVDFHTLLTYACQCGNIDIVKMLVEEFHVDADKRDKRDFMTPLMFAALFNEPDLSIVRYLREECSVDIDCVDKEGNTAAQLAEQNENTIIFEYLSNPVPSCEEKADEIAPAATDPVGHVEERTEVDQEQQIRLASLESALEEANKRCSRLVEENTALDDAYKLIQAHIETFQTENANLRARVTKETEKLKRNKTKWEEALSVSVDEVSVLRRKMLTNSERETTKLRDENTQLRREIAAARGEAAVAQTETAELTARLENETDARERREQELTVQMSEMRMELEEKDRQMQRAEESRRIQEAAQDKKEKDEFECDDFVVIEPPEQPIRH